MMRLMVRAAHPTNYELPHWVNPGGDWPYNLGHFDGPDTGQNQRWVDLLLGANSE
jgi:hypothetical protein